VQSSPGRLHANGSLYPPGHLGIDGALVGVNVGRLVGDTVGAILVGERDGSCVAVGFVEGSCVGALDEHVSHVAGQISRSLASSLHSPAKLSHEGLSAPRPGHVGRLGVSVGRAVVGALDG
jgi:hypothetical protein